MASTRERVAALAQNYLDDREPDFERAFADSDISSTDALAFLKSVSKEFGREVPAEEFAYFKNLGDLVSYLDS